MSDHPLLEMKNITKLFPGVKALDGVDFTLLRGEVHSLVGENGAGKSTLIKVLTGVYRSEGGMMYLNGKRIQPHSPSDAQFLGISAVYQEVNLIPELSVEENLFLGRQPMKFGRIHWKEIRNQAIKALKALDLNIDVSLPLSACSIAIRQMVAIARGLEISARVLILDEPTSSLDKNEAEHLFAVIRKLKADGLGIIFISHFLDQIYVISDRMTILRNGKLIGTYEAKSLSTLELVSKMTGKSLERFKLGNVHIPGVRKRLGKETALEVRSLGKKNAIMPTSLKILEGEVVGLAGLLGSGRTELALLVFGVKRPDSGTIIIRGQRARISSPRKAMKLGLGFLPEDRKTQGIIPNLSLRENIILSLQAARGWLRTYSRREQDAICSRFINALNIATPDAEKPAGELSGGNQQKAILARWLASQPKILILDEPTRGIDVGAKAEIEELIRKLCDEGMAILFISGELEEVVRISDRVVVLRDRKKIRELTGEDITMTNIMKTIAEGEPEAHAQNPSQV